MAVNEENEAADEPPMIVLKRVDCFEDNQFVRTAGGSLFSTSTNNCQQPYTRTMIEDDTVVLTDALELE